MASTISFKMRNAKDSESVSFNGVLISVGQLKRMIMEQKFKSTSAAASFGLVVCDAQTEKGTGAGARAVRRSDESVPIDRLVPLLAAEFADETTLLPANSTVLIKRVPKISSSTGAPPPPQPPPVPSNPMPSAAPVLAEVSNGRPSARHPPGAWVDPPAPLLAAAAQGSPPPPPPESADPLLKDLLPISAKLEARSAAPSTAADTPAADTASEDQLLAAMLSDGAAKTKAPAGGAWSGRGSGAGGRGSGRGRGGPPPKSDQDTPPHWYVCYRCGVPGHFKWNCPHIGAKPGETVVVPRAPRGIPKAFLQKVDGKEEGSLLLEDGTYAKQIIFEEDLRAETARAADANAAIPDELICRAPECGRMLREPVRTRALQTGERRGLGERGKASRGCPPACRWAHWHPRTRQDHTNRKCRLTPHELDWVPEERPADAGGVCGAAGGVQEVGAGGKLTRRTPRRCSSPVARRACAASAS